MPITNGKYVAPTWSNGGGTPLSAANLQDMSDAIAFSGRIATGTYTGTGKHASSVTSSDANVLTLPFPPKLVFVATLALDTAYFISGCKMACSTKYQLTSSDLHVRYTLLARWDGNTLRWAANSASEQLNYSGETYYWVAIG